MVTRNIINKNISGNIVKNIKGSISIEAIVFLPIFLIVSVMFLSLIMLVKVSTDVDYAVSKCLIETNMDEYIASKLEIKTGSLLKINMSNDNEMIDEQINKSSIKNITNTAKNSMLSMKIKNELDAMESGKIRFFRRIKNRKVNSKTLGENEEVSITYNFIFPFKIIKSWNKELEVRRTIRRFKKGDSIKDYGLVSETRKVNMEIWSKPNLERAKIISSILGGCVNFNGTSIDKIENGNLISIVSLDYRKETYEDIDKIRVKLQSDIKRLKNFKEGMVDGKMIKEGSYNRKILHLVLPNSPKSEEIEYLLTVIRTYLKNQDLDFKITAIIDSNE